MRTTLGADNRNACLTIGKISIHTWQADGLTKTDHF
jgi:hypothetical protein